LIAWAIPVFRQRFLDYGARASPEQESKEKEARHKDEASPSSLPILNLLDAAAKIQVPHSWFTSFYVVSVLSSLFWLTEVLRKGPLFKTFTQDSLSADPRSMTLSQVNLAWILMFIQGSRRLYESLTLSSSSSKSTSKMWIGHWVIGVGFYIATGVAIWVEGDGTYSFSPDLDDHICSPKMENTVMPMLTFSTQTATLQEHTFTIQDLIPSAPSARTFIALPMFMLASGLQHDVHTYLASLKAPSIATASSSSPASKKSHYILPTHHSFHLSLTPHYLAECIIYLSLSILAAPPGYFVNGTIFCALIFTTVNLGVTADGTREWYRRRFGKEEIGNAARMIPGIW
jgi:3-oxo-5-alpha-steroid 4-dehydrogenase 3